MEGEMINHIQYSLQRRGVTEKSTSISFAPQRLCGKKTVFAAALNIFFSLVLIGISLAEDPHELNRKAVQLINKGDFENALVYLLKARDISPTNESIGKNLASCYTFIGSRKMEEEKFSDAISEFKSALYYSDDPNTRFYKGYAHYRLKEYGDAAYELEKAMNSGMSSPDLYIVTGKVFYDNGETVSAINSWNKGIELYPDNKEIKRLLDKAERETKAEEGFNKSDTHHFTLQYDAGKDEAIGNKILDVLEEAYSDVNTDLAHYPDRNTVVVLYTGKAFRETTQGPDWSGGLYDGKIRLPVGGIKDVTAELKAVLYHEYAHVVIRSLTQGKRVPMWLNEGIAEYEGAKFAARPLKELTNAIKEGKLIPFNKLEGSFSELSGKESYLAYLQSYSLVKYIIDRFGLHAVREVLENIGRGDRIEKALNRALEPYGLDYTGLAAEWGKTFK